MNPKVSEALFARKEGGMLSLTGESLIKILHAVLEKGYPFRFKLKGDSMFPFLKDGDFITVFPLMGSSLKKGDITAFVHPTRGKLTVHRIIDKKRSYFVLKGDNTRGDDGLVHRDKILGLLKKVERNGKKTSFGMGPERRFIVFLSKRNLLSPIARMIRTLSLSNKSMEIQ